MTCFSLYTLQCIGVGNMVLRIRLYFIFVCCEFYILYMGDISSSHTYIMGHLVYLDVL